MSPGCSNQDPKQPQVASGDLGGLLVRIESQYYIVFNYNVVEQEIEDILSEILCKRFNFKEMISGYRKLSQMAIVIVKFMWIKVNPDVLCDACCLVQSFYREVKQRIMGGVCMCAYVCAFIYSVILMYHTISYCSIILFHWCYGSSTGLGIHD